MITAARKAKNGREVMRLMKLRSKLPAEGDSGGAGGGAGGGPSFTGASLGDSEGGGGDVTTSGGGCGGGSGGGGGGGSGGGGVRGSSAEGKDVEEATATPLSGSGAGGEGKGNDDADDASTSPLLAPTLSLRRVKSSVVRDAETLELRARGWCATAANTATGNMRLSVSTSDSGDGRPALDMSTQCLNVSVSCSDGTGRPLPLQINFRDLPCNVTSPDGNLSSFNEAALQYCYGDKARSVEEIMFFSKRYFEKMGVPKMKRAFSIEASEAGSGSGSGSDDYDDYEEDEEYDVYYSEGEDDDGTDAAPPQPELAASVSYTPMAMDDIVHAQLLMIQRVGNQLKINFAAAGILLRHCAWNDGEVLRRAHRGDLAGRTALFTEAGVAAAETTEFSKQGSPDDIIECLVCCSDVPRSGASAMGCGHAFCDSCWKDYLENQLKNGDVRGSSCLATQCPAHKCASIVGYDVFEKVLEPLLFKKYTRILQLSFVDESDSATWCPAAGCGNVVAFSQRKHTVQCRYVWGFGCGVYVSMCVWMRVCAAVDDARWSSALIIEGSTRTRLHDPHVIERSRLVIVSLLTIPSTLQWLAAVATSSASAASRMRTPRRCARV